MSVAAKTHPAQALRAAAVSILATGVDLVVLLLLVRGLRMVPGLAAMAGGLAGGTIAFTLSRHWVYSAAGSRAVGSSARQAALFALFNVVGSAVLCGGLVQLATVSLGAPVVVAKGAAAALVFLCWNYPIASFLVFRKEQHVAP